MPTPRILLSLVLGALCLVPQASATDPRTEVAARAGERVLSFDDLNVLLLRRYGMSQDGRGALRHLLEMRLLEVLEQERGIQIDSNRINDAIEALEEQLLGLGEATSLEAYLKQNRVSLELFRRTMRLGLVQEILTREALSLDPSAPVTGEQQRLWINEELQLRGYEERPAPWDGGIVAISGEIVIGIDEFTQHLHQQLPEENLRESCWQLLALSALEERCAGIPTDKVEAAINTELDRRRAEIRADPQYKGITFDRILEAQGVIPGTLHLDPSIRISALARLWVEQNYNENALQGAYASEQRLFDGRYGEAFQLSVLVLVAGKTKNSLVKRTFKEAEQQIAIWMSDIQRPKDFEDLVRGHSEEPRTRERQGDIGWVTRYTEAVPETLRTAVFDAADRGTLVRSQGLALNAVKERLIGPVSLQGGTMLAFATGYRPDPEWVVMRQHVRMELRRKLVEETLPKDSVVTFFD